MCEYDTEVDEHPGAQSARWVFTSFDTAMEPNLDSPGAYMIYQGEVCPETQRNHLQGYIRFTKRQRWEQVVEYFSHYSRKKVWCQIARGTEHQNRVYCTKVEKAVKKGKAKTILPMEVWKAPVEQGTFDASQGISGRRTDLTPVAEAIRSGATKNDIAREFPVQFIRYTKGIETYINTVQPLPPLEREIRVWVLYGKGGVGKSHRIWKTLTDDWTEIYCVCPGRGPFDKYTNEKMVFFEEFDWRKWDIHDMKKYLDKWPCQIDCRFCNKYAYWIGVVLTSNDPPEMWYPTELPHNREALFRRFTKVLEITSREQVIEW